MTPTQHPRPYWRPIPDPAGGRWRLAGGWVGFSRLERLTRGGAPEIVDAAPDDVLAALTAPRPPVLGLSPSLADVIPLPGPVTTGSESSFAAFTVTVAVCDGAGPPAATLAAPSISPFFISLYLSTVRCMLSLISKSFATASWSSDSSSHIFWIFGCAL